MGEFWYRLTRVVADNGPLNTYVCVLYVCLGYCILVLLAFIVLGLVFFQYRVNRVAVKNVSKMTYAVLSGTYNLNSVTTVAVSIALLAIAVQAWDALNAAAAADGGGDGGCDAVICACV